MKRRRVFVGLRWLVLVGTLWLGACAAGSDMPIHAFEFDAWEDSPGIEVLDYQYGDSRTPGTHPSADALQTDQVGQQVDVDGAMRRGEFLYVKWRVRATGKVYEDRVDLRNRLPRNLDHCRIRFVVDGTQLHVYVISPEKVAGLCPADPAAAYKQTPRPRHLFIEYCSRKITQIYPDQSNISRAME